MGIQHEVSMTNFPKQGLFLGMRVKVCFCYDTSNTIGGTVIRDDVTSPCLTIIALDDGRIVTSMECQYTICDQIETTEPKDYAVDFDGYLCEEKYPEIGEPYMHMIEHFKRLKEQGNRLILNTLREGVLLENAIAWCNSHGLYFDKHNENLEYRIKKYGEDQRKIGADFYCDDHSYYLMPKGVNLNAEIPQKTCGH